MKYLLLLTFYLFSHFLYSQVSQAELSNLISPDLEAERYWEYAYRMKDTVTEMRWRIKYLANPNDTNAVYISCKKGEVQTVYKIPRILGGYRTYFVPAFVKETTHCIYFQYGCATSCQAILVFSKIRRKFTDFQKVVEADLNLNLIVRVTDWNTHNNEFELELIDLREYKNYIIMYENYCRAASYKNICVNEVIFSDKQVIIKTTLSAPKNWEKEIKETRVIKF
ncbi:hypothetical protein Fleli_1315 [Bernardetia litoralis DSM 6794]|uniref:Uncharacterized protein n=1 Tax=Bernardetia litoralis (strain ATCC 23117 / DSM 6794 / NBRC 15988 / NCIMB 1366 / Fx l1 / Sio-4) TaxID=880071 RepID=I4AIG2_BERLS|nr:hypothetical protein [Bernardetia litoralis]AFM03747.1 hypothetical protein Fleli_1315 [Bernardetia litoralis DSM 6794]